MKKQSSRWNPKHLKQAIVRSPARALLIAIVLAAAGVTALHLSQAEEQTPPTSTPPVSTVRATDEAPEQIIVKYKAGVAKAETESVAEAVGADEKEEIPQLRMKVLKVPKQQRAAILERLKADPRVEYAEPDVVWHADYTKPNDPEYGKQWVWPVTMADLLWDKQKGGNFTVATVDTGVANHPDLSGKIAPGGFDLVNNDNDPTDDHGHGTATAGIIAANTNNSVGVAGACWNCRIVPFKALDAQGNVTGSNAAQGIQRAADSGAKIINVSFGGPAPSTAVEDAVNYAAGKGAIIVTSAGNTGKDEANYPSAYPAAISVSATDQNDKLASYSTFHSTVDIAAPGNHRVLVHDGTGYKDNFGTSFAAPTVAGILADLWSAFPNATVAQLRDAITSTADPCCDGKIPSGRINAMKAYNKLAGTLNADTAKPTISFVSPGTEGMNISGDAPITFSASDNVGVVKIHIQTDDRNPAVVPPASFGSLSWNTTGATDGPHKISLTAYDAAGNFTKVERNITINNAAPDTVKPTITFTSPAAGATVSGSTPIAADVTDNAGVAKVQLYIDDTLKVIDIVAPYGGNWGTTAYANGQHTIKLVAYDSNGNTTEATRTVTVNNGGTTPPPTTPPPTTPPPTTPPPTTPPPGTNPKSPDINGSGKVDLTDLSILLSNWNKTTANADLNNSGKVDLTDLSMLLSKWNTAG